MDSYKWKILVLVATTTDIKHDLRWGMSKAGTPKLGLTLALAGTEPLALALLHQGDMPWVRAWREFIKSTRYNLACLYPVPGPP